MPKRKVTDYPPEERAEFELQANVAIAAGWDVAEHCAHKVKSLGAPLPFGNPPNGVNDWQKLPEFQNEYDAIIPVLRTMTAREWSVFWSNLYHDRFDGEAVSAVNPSQAICAAFHATPRDLCHYYLIAKGHKTP